MKKIIYFLIILSLSAQVFAKKEDKKGKGNEAPPGVSERSSPNSNSEILHQMGSPRNEELDPNSIRVLVWNMFKGRCEHEIDGRCTATNWSDDFHRLAADSDIFMAQEASLTTFMKSQFEKQSDFVWNFAKAISKNEVASGVITGSRVKSTNQPVALKSPDTEVPFSKLYKSMMFSYHRMRGSSKELLSINIHAFNNPYLSSSFEKYSNHIRQAVSFIEKHEGPIIFAGDFNTFAENSDRLEFLNELLVSNLGFTKVQFKNEEDSKFTKAYGRSGILDHVFIRGLEVVKDNSNPEVERDFAMVHGENCWTKDCKVGSSDHRPLSVVLKIK